MVKGIRSDEEERRGRESKREREGEGRERELREWSGEVGESERDRGG